MKTELASTNLTQRDFRLFLQEELLKRCRKNPQYSLRSFAKSLGIAHSALTEMLNNKRKITRKSIEKIGLALGLGLEEISEYQKLNSGTAKKVEKEVNYQQLSLDQFAIISDWYHYAILELIKIEGFPHTVQDFSRALGITKAEANIAVERLERIGLLEKNEQGRYIENNTGFATNISGNLTSTASRKLQKQILEQSIEALETIPVSKRNHTSMTMACDPELLPEAIERIKKFRRELSDFLESSGRPTEVFQLSISLFPITEISNKNESED